MAEARWVRRLQCVVCEAFSFKIVEDGRTWQMQCNHCGEIVADVVANDTKTYSNGTWAKARVP